MPRPGSHEEEIERTEKLMDKGNGDAFYHRAGYYSRGVMGMPDHQKSNELLLKAGELGCAYAYYNLGQSYNNGTGVEVDNNKAIYYWELAAAKGGDIMGRNNLGCVEGNSGNHHRAMKHFIISAKAGEKKSLDNVKIGFMKGVVTKEVNANTLRAYQKSLDEMKSDAREKAAALNMNRTFYS